MSVAESQEYYDSRSQFGDGNSNWGFSNQHDRFAPVQRKNVLDICRDLAGKSSRRGDKSVQFVAEVLQALFFDPEIDLCGILPNCSDYDAVCQLIDYKSHFFDIFFDGNEKQANELWKALYHQLQNCHLATDVSRESAILRCISTYVIRLLPTEGAEAMPVPRTSVRQRVHTPLDLFLPTSPILNRVRFDQDVDRCTSTTLHPRHLTMFCNMVTTFCSVEEFPSPTRLMLLRHLLKQFHVFCTAESTDPDMIAIKNAVFANPPFSNALYDFFFTFLEQCPSTNSLLDLIGSWATYCRPWRYSDDGRSYSDLLHSPQFHPFIRSQERFYRILLGKILRKLSEHDINAGTTKTIKSVLDMTWREPMCTLLRKFVGVDARPAVRKLLNRVAEVYKREKIKLRIAQQEADVPWWKTFLNQADTRPTEASRVLVEELEPILKDSDAFMKTNYVPEFPTAPLSPLGPSTAAPQITTATVFDETPKRGLLPDHEKDPVTGLMYVTPLGRNQILTRERHFQFSPCHSYVPNWQSPPRQNEFAPMVYATSKFAGLLNSLKIVQDLGKHYFDGGALGSVVRVIMDPPCPNPHSCVASPVFSRTLKKTPPTLRLRVLANNCVLLSFFFLALFFYFGWWALIPLLFFLLTLFMMYAASTE